MLASSCRGGDPGAAYGIFFPRHGGGGVPPAALLEGKLALEGACLWIVRSDGARVLPIWPAAFGITVVDGRAAIVDSSGVLARDGDDVRLGGGETVSEQDAFALMGQQPPQGCRAPNYWAVSELRRAAPVAPSPSPQTEGY